jgi:hypothetical protein
LRGIRWNASRTPSMFSSDTRFTFETAPFFCVRPVLQQFYISTCLLLKRCSLWKLQHLKSFKNKLL